MCAIYGSIGLAPEPARIDIVAHRGPDGRGWEVHDSAAGPVALGHRRLAIIDTSDAGLQPMADAAGRYRLVFNGEIYNYVELRAELMAQGEAFRTQSDSEVLLRAYLVWGKACLLRLRGMFAFLIWDRVEGRMFAARDRYGIKPLYVVETARGVAFASEIKQLIGIDGTTPRMNIARVHDFLEAGISDHTAETMFAAVRQLRGGECAVASASGGRVTLAVSRWAAIVRGRIAMGEREAAERFRSLLDDSVRLHLRSDVPVGSCLSGGLDSSTIVCLAAKRLPADRRITTVSACYADKAVDEKPFMDAVVAHANTAPLFVYPQADDLRGVVSTLTWHQDEPFGSTSIFAQWCVFEAARRAGVKVMLDGQGADEQLAGYHFAFPYHLAALARQGRFAEAHGVVRARQRDHGVGGLAQWLRASATMTKSVLPSLSAAAFRTAAGGRWLNAPLIRDHGNKRGAMATAADAIGLGAATDLRSLCLLMTYASNLQMLLHWEDRNSMAHAIEARVPFLDHPLVEFSLALDDQHKIAGSDTKRVLRRAMADVLPSVVLERRDKLGFATPEEVWLRGPLRSFVVAGTEATLTRYPGLFDSAAVRGMRDDMLAGLGPMKPALWRIVSLGVWGERFGVTV